MSLFKGNYLRVLTPRTTDGQSPMLDESGRLIYKETEMPLSAKRDLDTKNKYLPDILKMKIEVVSNDEPVHVGQAKAAKK